MVQPLGRPDQDGASGAPARDGEVAVREEFAAAERLNTAEAYASFARRHPGHSLAAEARLRAERMRAVD